MSHELIAALLAGLAGLLTALAELRGRSIREDLAALRERVAKIEGKVGV